MKNKLLTLIAFLGILFSCSKDDHKIILPEVTTVLVEMVTEEGAYVHGKYIVPEETHIVDHGFIYYLSNYYYQGERDLTSMYKFSLGESNENEMEFFGTLNKNLIKGNEFIVCSYVETDSEIMYGEFLNFISQSGEIDGWISFEPHLAGVGDTITVKGKYLNAYVLFGDAVQVAFFKSDTLLKVTVPDNINSLAFPLTINVANNHYQSDHELHIKPPVIDSVSTKYVVSGNKIELYGKYLSLIDEISIDGKELGIYENNFEVVSNNKIKLTIPSSIGTGALALEIKYLGIKNNFDNLLTGILPIIESFSPTRVWGVDTVTIKGQNLKAINSFYKPNPTYTYTSIIEKSDTIMKLVVNGFIPYDTLIANYNGLEVKANSKLGLKKPSITSVDKKTFYGNDQITIKGERFLTVTKLRIGDQNCNSTYVEDENTLKGWVEAPAGIHKLSLYYPYANYYDTITEFEIDVLKAEIIDITPKSFMRGQKLIATARNINPIDNPQFKILNNYCKVLERNGDEFTIQYNIDDEIQGTQKMTLGYGVQELEYPEVLNFVEPWESVGESNFVGAVDYIGICNGKPTLIDNSTKIYQFNSSNDRWEFFSTIDLSGAHFNNSRAYKDKLILSYYKDKYELAIFSMTDKTLTKIERDEKQDKIHGNIFTFLNGNKFYVGSDYIFLCFNLDTYIWSEKSMTPDKFDSGHRTACFTANNHGYLAYEWGQIGYDGLSDFWKYNFEDDDWIQLDGFDANIDKEGVAFVQNEKVYLAHHGEYGLKGLKMYDPANDSWKGVVPPPGDGSNYHIFPLNGYLYFSNYFWNSKSIKTYKMPIDGLIPLE